MMEVQGKASRRSWLDWLRPKQGAVDAVGPAPSQNAENTNETAPEDGIYTLRKFVGRQVGVTKPLVAIFSLLLLSAVIWRVSRKRDSPKLSSHMLSSQKLSSHNESVPLTIDDSTIWGCLDDLIEENDQMNKAWASTYPSIKAAFQKYFAPSLENGQALTHDPLATINGHVAKVRGCQFPSDSSAKVRSDFLQHVRALHSICRMTTVRLQELKHSDNLKHSFESAISRVDEEPYINSGRDTFGISSSMKADDFLHSLSRVASGRRRLVDGEVAANHGVEVLRRFPVHKDSDSNSGIEDPLGIFSSMKADDFLDAPMTVNGERRQSAAVTVADKNFLEVPRSSAARKDLGSNSYRQRTPSISSPMTPAEFLGALGMVGNEQRHGVDIKLSQKLICLLLIEDTRNISNLAARYYFLQPFGEDDPTNAIPSTAEHQIPYSERPFRTGALAQAADQIFRQSEGDTNYARIRKIYRIADNWTSEEVLQATKKQEEESAYKLEQRLRIKREQMRVMLNEGIQMDDLEIIALFLL